jgi:hypothetical protein
MNEKKINIKNLLKELIETEKKYLECLKILKKVKINT